MLLNKKEQVLSLVFICYSLNKCITIFPRMVDFLHENADIICTIVINLNTYEIIFLWFTYSLHSVSTTLHMHEKINGCSLLSHDMISIMYRTPNDISVECDSCPTQCALTKVQVPCEILIHQYPGCRVSERVAQLDDCFILFKAFGKVHFCTSPCSLVLVELGWGRMENDRVSWEKMEGNGREEWEKMANAPVSHKNTKIFLFVPQLMHT